MDKIRSKFLQIEDKRHESYIEHNLVDVLIMVMGAVISGITELADMMVYFTSKKEFYKNNFGIENYPSKPTLSRILNMVDGDEVGKIVIQIMHENAENIGEIIAVDGKAIRSTGKKSNAHSFLQILTAYATERGQYTCSCQCASSSDAENLVASCIHISRMLPAREMFRNGTTTYIGAGSMDSVHKVARAVNAYYFAPLEKQGSCLTNV